jgi:hypothetical protein
MVDSGMACVLRRLQYLSREHCQLAMFVHFFFLDNCKLLSSDKYWRQIKIASKKQMPARRHLE